MYKVPVVRMSKSLCAEGFVSSSSRSVVQIFFPKTYIIWQDLASSRPYIHNIIIQAATSRSQT